MRNTPGGPAVLMGVRDPGHRFMPNRLVFPGGAVDPADARAAAAAEPRPDMLDALAHTARPGLARAIAMAAARELREETGLSLGTPPRLDALDYLCRAITPKSSPIRFNARFLVAPAEMVEGEAADSAELHQVAFRPVAELLQADMMQITREVLLRLVAWLDLAQDARRFPRALHVFREKRWSAERARRTRPATVVP